MAMRAEISGLRKALCFLIVLGPNPDHTKFFGDIAIYRAARQVSQLVKEGGIVTKALPCPQRGCVWVDYSAPGHTTLDAAQRGIPPSWFRPSPLSNRNPNWGYAYPFFPRNNFVCAATRNFCPPR